MSSYCHFAYACSSDLFSDTGEEFDIRPLSNRPKEEADAVLIGKNVCVCRVCHYQARPIIEIRAVLIVPMAL